MRTQVRVQTGWFATKRTKDTKYIERKNFGPFVSSVVNTELRIGTAVRKE